MKKLLLFFCLLLSVLFVSCDRYKIHKLDGMWQLKTVQHDDGSIVYVDSVYYSFQRKVVFSYTVLLNPKQAMPIYGYVDMPSENQVHILIDANNIGNNFEWFLELSGWSSHDIVFDIINYNRSDLVLFDSISKKIFTLKKF